MDIVIGIVGALIGGFLLSFFVNTAGGGLIFTFFTALLGAVILLWVVGMVRRTLGIAGFVCRRHAGQHCLPAAPVRHSTRRSSTRS